MPARKQNGKGVGDVLRYIKNNHLISGGLGLLPNPAAQAASTIAKLVGLGKRKRKAPKKHVLKGRGIFGDLGNGIGSIFGGLGGGLGSVAHGLFGSGKRRKRRAVISI